MTNQKIKQSTLNAVDNSSFTALPQETAHARIIRMLELTKLVGLSKATIYNKIKDGTFPKPVTLGANSVGWLSTDIDHWFNQLIAERDQGAA